MNSPRSPNTARMTPYQLAMHKQNMTKKAVRKIMTDVKKSRENIDPAKSMKISKVRKFKFHEQASKLEVDEAAEGLHI